MSIDASQQVTLRLPADLWSEVLAIAAREPERSRNDVLVELIAAEVKRRRRAEALGRIAAHRVDTLGAGDSTAVIRALRDGRRNR